MSFITAFSTGDNTNRRGCIKAERDALLAFKAEAIYHHKAHPISTWGDQTDDCCQWAGVRCDNNSGHVIRLNFSDEEAGLSGNMSESLIGLQYLTYLNLHGNCFINTSIPKWFGSLESLVHLDLSFNCFTGVIPHELGNLTKLRYLNLTSNEGLKVVDDTEWLSGLSSLRYLSMAGVDFSGVDDVMQSLNKLQHLKYVSLRACSISSIPESLPHLNFTSLTFMDFSWNMLYGISIPEWLFRIPNLRELYMYSTGLIGTIPSSVGNVTSLQLLNLSWNEGISGDMATGFGGLRNLLWLGLDRTFMGKSLEEDFRDAFSGCIRRNLNVFSFGYSELKGPLPDWLGECRNLKRYQYTKISKVYYLMFPFFQKNGDKHKEQY